MKNRKVKSKKQTKPKTLKKLGGSRVGLMRRDPKKKIIKLQIRKKRPVHKRILLHPITLLFVLVIGVFVFEWTYRVVADTLTITATVPAAILTSPAVITSPTDGFSFNTSNILVEGYCPDGSYVNVYNNGGFSGTSMCTTGGTFQLELSLFLGTNDLVARAYNITNQAGPTSSGITVTYTIAVSPTTPTPPPTTVLPLLLVSNFQYQTFVVNNTFSWRVQIQGGIPPITLTISWGDSKQTEVITNASGLLTIKHTFSQQGYYPVIIKATDANGDVHILQLAALIRNPNAANIYSTNYLLPAPSVGGLAKFFESTKTWLWIAWPSLAIIGLMITSFWLGERQEYKDAIFRRHHKN
jgi:hypothetical protein